MDRRYERTLVDRVKPNEAASVDLPAADAACVYPDQNGSNLVTE